MESLARFLGLPRFVARAALQAGLFHALFVAGVTIIKSGTNALFLSRADPRQLPLLYAAVAIVVSAVTSGLARVLARHPIRTVFPVAYAIAAASIGVATAAVSAHVPGATAVLYVLGEATATSGSVLFWSRVMEGFNVRDQRRVLGVVGGGGMAGAAIGGLAMTVVVDAVGVITPTASAALLWIAAMPLMRRVRSRSQHGVDAQANKRASLTPALRYLAGGGYPRAVAGLVVLLAAIGATTDFVFRTAAARTSGETDMAGLFGMLNAVVGIVVVLFQLGLTSRLLERLGVFFFAAIVPTTLLALALAHLALGVHERTADTAFLLVIAMKGVEMAGAYSLNQSAVSLLYNPMPVELRAQARTLIDGAIKKTGAAIAGIVLGVFAAFAPDAVDAWTVVAVSGGALALLPLLRLRYVDALSSRLAVPRARRVNVRIDPSDRTTRLALEKGLDSDDADDVLAALHTLGASWTPPQPRLLRLIDHPDERVRAAALALVPTSVDAVLGMRLLAIADARDARRPRAEAVRALARAMPGRAAELVTRYFDDDDAGVITAALEVSLRHKETPRARARLDQLVEALPILSTRWRREIARLLGALAEPRYNAALARLIDDEDASVRQRAIEAAALERDASLVPNLIRHLGDVAARPATVLALVRFGDLAVPDLSAALDDTSTSFVVRSHVARVLQRIGSDAAVNALLFSNPRDNAWLQTRIATALSAIVQASPGVVVDKKRTDEAIGRRLVAFQAYGDAVHDLRSSKERALHLLTRAVDDRRRQNLTIAFELLGLHRGQARMQRVLEGLLSDDDPRRNDALELLDAALTADPLRDDFLSLLDARRPAKDASAALSSARRLCSSRDPLLRAIARATVDRMGHDVPDESTAPGIMPGTVELQGGRMADDLVERLFLLEDVDLFAGLPTDDLLAIASIATELSLPAGEYLYREGEPGTSLFVIVEGLVDLTREGRRVMVNHAGESVGQVSFLDRGLRPVTARVAGKEPARFLVVERDAFLDLMAERPGLMNAFFGVLAQRLRALIESPRQT